MELKDLRIALFGFNKHDVCEYISQLNDVYEQKEEQKDEERREAMEELSRKNEELNDYASRLNQENTELMRLNDELRKKLESAECRANSQELQMKEMHNVTASVIEEVKEQLSLAEKRISDFLTEQGYE